MEKDTKKLLKVINGLKDEELKQTMLNLIAEDDKEEVEEKEEKEEVVEPEVKEEPKEEKKEEPAPKEDLEKEELKKELQKLKEEKDKLAEAHSNRLKEIESFLSQSNGFGFKAKPLPVEDKEKIYDLDSVAQRVTQRRG